MTMTTTMMVLVVATTSLHRVAGLAVTNVGTVLYTRSDLTRTWTERDAIGLHGRMLVDQLLPRRAADHDDGAAAFVAYLKLIADKSAIVEDDESRTRAMVAVADAMGGYMHGVLLAAVKASYYEGRAGFAATSALYGIMRKIKFVLDTDGRGWLTPVEHAKARDNGNSSSGGGGDGGGGGGGDGDDYEESDLPGDACAAIYSARPAGDEPTPVMVPAFDDDWRPGSLAVPFAAGRRLYPVDAPGLQVYGADGRGGRPLLARYYRLAVQCASSTGGADRFAIDVRRWLDDTVAPLLVRPRRWYPVLAGASRVIRAAARDGRAAVATRNRRRTAVTRNDDDGSRACDDGPGGRLPNSNVFLLVVLLSLTFTWLCFGLFVVVNKPRRPPPR